MKNTHIKSVAATVALLFAFAPLAHAEMRVGGVVDTDIDSKVEVGDKMEMGGKMEMGVKMTAGASATSSIKTDDDSDGDMDMMGEKGGMMNREGDERGIDRAQMMADEHALEALGKVEMHMDLESDEGDEHATGTPEIDEAEKVHSEHDFQDFVHHKAKSDDHLKSVSVKDGKVEVEYAEPAKLFGFMKTTLNAHASVDAQDKVEVSYPWYHIFMKKHVSKASIQSSIARAIASERIAVKQGMGTTTIQAQISAAMGIPNLFEIIAKELQSTRVKAEAEAEAK